MATITGYTAARMQQIEDETVTGGLIVGDDLILTQRDATQINAGNVRGPQGIQGPIGEVSQATLDAAIAGVNGNISTLQNEVDGYHGANGITELMLGSGIVTNAKLGPDAVTADKIADNAVQRAHILDNAVGANELEDGSVQWYHMAANSIDSPQYVDGSIDEIHLSNSLAVEQSSTLANNWSGYIYYWLVGNMVFVQITVDIETGPSSQTLFTLPSAYRPKRRTRIPAATATASFEFVTFETSGAVTAYTDTSWLYCTGAFLT